MKLKLTKQAARLGTLEDYRAKGWTDDLMVANGIAEPITLLDVVLEPYRRDCFKHDLHPNPTGWAEDRINALTNMEFLETLSYALAEMLDPSE